MTQADIRESIKEIYDTFCKRSYSMTFTLESISQIFDIGNEIFFKNNARDVEKIMNQTPSLAPDITDDEPFSFERTITIFNKLENKYNTVTTELIHKIYEINHRLAWIDYTRRYRTYILDTYPEYPDDEYINYLAAVVLYDKKDFENALNCINHSISQNASCAMYTHLKGMCLYQLGEFDSARTYLYQGLFLMELLQDSPPRLKGKPEIYPNFPIEYHTSAELIRLDLVRIDRLEESFHLDIMPLLNEAG